MQRHAYCILAHNEPAILQRLVELLDDPRNDIFIHIDKRSHFTEFLNIRGKNSSLAYLPNRIHCGWGTLNIVKAELMLF